MCKPIEAEFGDNEVTGGHDDVKPVQLNELSDPLIRSFKFVHGVSLQRLRDCVQRIQQVESDRHGPSILMTFGAETRECGELFPYVFAAQFEHVIARICGLRGAIQRDGFAVACGIG